MEVEIMSTITFKNNTEYNERRSEKKQKEIL